MERDEIVGAHQPHEIDGGIAPLEEADGIDRVGARAAGLEARDYDLWMMRDLPRDFDARFKVGRLCALRGLPGLTSHHT